MIENTLKSYLIKAEYLLVFIHTPKKSNPRLNHIGVHIPSMDFAAAIKATRVHYNPLRRSLSKKDQIDNLKKLLFSENTLIISLIKEAPGKNDKAFKTALTTNAISQKQDLHLLHYGLIYCANKSRKDRPMKGWKIPCPIVVMKQFQSVLKTPIANPTKKFSHSFTLLSRSKT